MLSWLTSTYPWGKFSKERCFLASSQSQTAYGKSRQERLTQSCSAWNYPFHSIIPAWVSFFTALPQYTPKLSCKAVCCPVKHNYRLCTEGRDVSWCPHLVQSLHGQDGVSWVHHDPCFLHSPVFFPRVLLTAQLYTVHRCQCSAACSASAGAGVRAAETRQGSFCSSARPDSKWLTKQLF